MQTAYEDFVAKRDEILKKDFTTYVPDGHCRSRGLDPLIGLVLGMAPEYELRQHLAWMLAGLPGAWSYYDTSSQHITLGAREIRGTTNPRRFQTVFSGLQQLTDGTHQTCACWQAKMPSS